MQLLKTIKQKLQNKGLSGASLSLILTIIQTAVILVFISYQRMSFFVEYPNLYSRERLDTVCNLAMQSILNKSASRLLFEESLVEQMEKGDYKFFGFVGNEELFDVIKGNNDSTCVTILELEINKQKNHRYFQFTFENSDEPDHIYGRYVTKIDDLDPEDIL